MGHGDWEKHGDWDKGKHGHGGGWEKNKQYHKGKGGNGHPKYWSGANPKKTDHREQDESQAIEKAIEALWIGQEFIDDPSKAYSLTGKISPVEKRYVVMEAQKNYMELLPTGDFRCTLCGKKADVPHILSDKHARKVSNQSSWPDSSDPAAQQKVAEMQRLQIQQLQEQEKKAEATHQQKGLEESQQAAASAAAAGTGAGGADGSAGAAGGAVVDLTCGDARAANASEAGDAAAALRRKEMELAKQQRHLTKEMELLAEKRVVAQKEMELAEKHEKEKQQQEEEAQRLQAEVEAAAEAQRLQAAAEAARVQAAAAVRDEEAAQEAAQKLAWQREEWRVNVDADMERKLAAASLTRQRTLDEQRTFDEKSAWQKMEGRVTELAAEAQQLRTAIQNVELHMVRQNGLTFEQCVILKAEYRLQQHKHTAAVAAAQAAAKAPATPPDQVRPQVQPPWATTSPPAGPPAASWPGATSSPPAAGQVPPPAAVFQADAAAPAPAAKVARIHQ